jgi:hypothetical protein
MAAKPTKISGLRTATHGTLLNTRHVLPDRRYRINQAICDAVLERWNSGVVDERKEAQLHYSINPLRHYPILPQARSLTSGRSINAKMCAFFAE